MRHALLALFSMSLVAALAVPVSAGGPAAETRALWVTRWDYKSPEDIREIMERVRRAHFNVVLFQVRGNADAFYRSRYEPWGEELGGRDPGFDPLSVAIREAHRRGLELHAYINVMTGWRGPVPPRSNRHLWRVHRAWFTRDASGTPQPLNGGYVQLAPGLRAVRDHTVTVVADIARRYPVDGIHLDYVRYLSERYSYDPVSVSVFRRATGRHPAELPGSWQTYRRTLMTRLVRRIRNALRATRPGVTLSVAVLGRMEVARATYGQDVARWLAEDLIDVSYPMIYEEDHRAFADQLAEHLRASSGKPVYPGIGVYRHDRPAQTLRQIALARRAGVRGFAVFDYRSLFGVLDADGGPAYVKPGVGPRIVRALLAGPLDRAVPPAGRRR
ncbi:MAG: family 10 glycosylhydrolase [bacterium]|nr:family 10 glycosylhydrolase [bacterium]